MNPIHRLQNLRMESDAARFRMDEMRPRFDAIGNRHEDKTAPRAVSAFQLFQTPPRLAARLVALLDIQPGARVLEPSAGLGRILDAIPEHAGERVAVEIAAQCAAELYRRGGCTLKQGDFLGMTPQQLGLFDCIAMNPPFTMRADIRHIMHARRFLKPGGKLAALCMDTDARSRELRHLCATWEQIPAGAFRSEGTNVPTVLLSMEAQP